MLSFATNALGFASGPYYGGKDDGMMCPTEMPPPKYTGPIDYSISAYGQSCIETEINCYNRYSPFIPMAMEVESGSVVSFKTRDLWDAPRTEGDMVGGWDMTASGNAVNTPAFPNSVLEPHGEYRHRTVYKFSVTECFDGNCWERKPKAL